MTRLRIRAGITLVELIVFLGLLGFLGSILLPLLFTSAENRSLQETAALVEQSGTQLMQTLTNRIRQAERILDPPPGGSGAVLALQVGSGSNNLMIFGFSTGSLITVRGLVQQTLSSTQVSVDTLNFRNTSVSNDRQSVLIKFKISRSIRLQMPRIYEQTFETLVTLFPDDRPVGGVCGCAPPGCGTANRYFWEVCVSGSCELAETQLKCP